MQSEWQQNVHTGHNIVDRNGNTIGTVRNVHHGTRAAGGPQMGGQGYVEVECDQPNLPNNLYVPMDTFQDCSGNTCRLTLSLDDLKNKRWDQRPGI